jgi:hypothetical protein
MVLLLVEACALSSVKQSADTAPEGFANAFKIALFAFRFVRGTFPVVVAIRIQEDIIVQMMSVYANIDAQLPKSGNSRLFWYVAKLDCAATASSELCLFMWIEGARSVEHRVQN